MIRNETEYQEASARLAAERNRLADHRSRLKEAGLSEAEIKRVIDPMESFHLQFQEEVESYERLKRGEFEEIDNLRGFGRLLISLRIAQGISQRELAKRLGVHESQVITRRAQRVLRNHAGTSHQDPRCAQRATAHESGNRAAAGDGTRLTSIQGGPSETRRSPVNVVLSPRAFPVNAVVLRGSTPAPVTPEPDRRLPPGRPLWRPPRA